MKRLAFLACVLSSLTFFAPEAGQAVQPTASSEEGPAPGWYYLWAQCSQEPSTTDERDLCDEGIEGEYAQALAVSSVFRMDAEFSKEYDQFKVEVTRRFGFEPGIGEVGPFASFQEAEAQIAVMLRTSRRIQKGLLAVTAIALEPHRLDDEPNDEERAREPAPLPPVMESYKGGSAQLWRDDAAKTCGLRLADGTEAAPALITDLWGEDGEGCPRELHEGSGIYRFDVPRSGMICGETGVCTELFDSDGHWIGVIDETPYPDISIDLFRDWGIIRSGQWNERLYSIPERRLLFERWPGDGLLRESRVIILGGVIIHDRLGIAINRETRDGKPEMGYFWLDTMTFELADEPTDTPTPIEANAFEVANRVCLKADGEREGPCTKAKLMLEGANMYGSLVLAQVQAVLGQIKADRGALEAAIGHFEAAVAFRQDQLAPEGEAKATLDVLAFGSDAYCVTSLSVREAIAIAQLRNAWTALDTYGRDMLAQLGAHSDRPGNGSDGTDLNDLSYSTRRMMVLIGNLFPQFNRPMDVPMLTDRLATQSVPSFDEGTEDYKIALMEAYLSADGENGAVAARFIKALGELEDVVSSEDGASSENGPPSAELLVASQEFTAAFDSFTPMLRDVVGGTGLESTLRRRLPYVCTAGDEQP